MVPLTANDDVAPLEGSVAVVVGAASGIGRAIAAEFARRGAQLALADRSPEVEQVAQQLHQEHDVAAMHSVYDVTDYAAVQRAAGEVAERFGRCDHVVFAAGMGSGKFGFPFWNLEPADWPRVLEVNLLGAVHVAHAFQPALVEPPGGSLLLLASVAGQIGSQTDPPYSASKAAVINFAQCAAKDLAPYGVRVNALCPGMVQTPLNRSVWQAWNDRQPPEGQQSYEEWTAAKIKQVVPLNRWQTPEDLAAMAVFLASPGGRNVTGQTINVDGGFVMHW